MGKKPRMCMRGCVEGNGNQFRMIANTMLAALDVHFDPAPPACPRRGRRLRGVVRPQPRRLDMIGDENREQPGQKRQKRQIAPSGDLPILV